MTIIIYGSTMGNTENAAELISEKMGGVKLVPVSDMSKETLVDADTILLGTSTWGAGDLQDDWEGKLGILTDADLKGKRVGLFGTGDQESYCDSFVDAMGILFEAVKDKGCEIIGAWPVTGYDFSSSAAVVNGQFVGLALDYDNQADLNEERISSWVNSLSL